MCFLCKTTLYLGVFADDKLHIFFLMFILCSYSHKNFDVLDNQLTFVFNMKFLIRNYYEILVDYHCA